MATHNAAKTRELGLLRRYCKSVNSQCLPIKKIRGCDAGFSVAAALQVCFDG